MTALILRGEDLVRPKAPKKQPKPETQVRRALLRLVIAANEYAEEQFFADDNGMCDKREAKRLDAAIRHAERILEARARRPKN